MSKQLRNIKLYSIEIKTIFNSIIRILNEYPGSDISIVVRITFTIENELLICKVIIVSNKNNNIVRRFELTKDDFIFIRNFVYKIKRRSTKQFKSWKKCIHIVSKWLNPNLFDWPTANNFCALFKYKEFNVEAYVQDIPLPMHFNKFKYVVSSDAPNVSIFIFNKTSKSL